MDTNQNHDRAKKVVESWPSWKQEFSVTRHSGHIIEKSRNESFDSKPRQQNIKEISS